MAQWINDGIQPIDIWDVDVRRIQPSPNNKNFVVARTVESLAYRTGQPCVHRARLADADVR